MLRGLIILEDTQVAFTLHDAGNATVTVCDGMTGFEKTVDCTTGELAASLDLAVGGDEQDHMSLDMRNELYEVAERLQTKLLLTGEECARLGQSKPEGGVSEHLLRMIP